MGSVWWGGGWGRGGWGGWGVKKTNRKKSRVKNAQCKGPDLSRNDVVAVQKRREVEGAGALKKSSWGSSAHSKSGNAETEGG